MRAIRAVPVIVALAASVPALAQEKVTLKEGPGVDLVRQNCVACHSLDYIPLNSPFLDDKGWQAVVTKMVKALGAPIKDEDQKPIAEYLAKYYGKH